MFKFDEVEKETLPSYVRFQVLKVVFLKIQVFWDVYAMSIGSYRRFGEWDCITAKMKVT
jgi:hypothetical protein